MVCAPACIHTETRLVTIASVLQLIKNQVAAMCEEVQHPEREVPKAIVLSVAGAGITGIVYLVPILFTLPDIATLLSVANGQPIGLLFKTVTESAAGGFGLLFLILGILFFAGVGSLTAASRCTYAFARDGAIPCSSLWSRISPHFDVPLWGLVLSTLVDCALGLIYFGSTAAFNSFTSVATICLSISYGLPILVSVLRGRRAVRDSTFSLGRFGYAINVATLCWIALATVLFCMPVSLPVTASTMNYASVVFAGFVAVSVAWYFVRGRSNFTGPPVPKDAQLHEGVVKIRALGPEGSGESTLGGGGGDVDIVEKAGGKI